MNERITMASNAGVIKKPQPSVESSKNTEVAKDEKTTLVLGTTGAGKTAFQVESLLKNIDLLKQK